MAFIVERIAVTGVSPSYGEIARALGVSVQRVSQLVQQLAGIVEHAPGSKRALVVRDVPQSREILLQVLRRLGWSVDGSIPTALGAAIAETFTAVKLPRFPDLVYLVDEIEEAA